MDQQTTKQQPHLHQRIPSYRGVLMIKKLNKRGIKNMLKQNIRRGLVKYHFTTDDHRIAGIVVGQIIGRKQQIGKPHTKNREKKGFKKGFRMIGMHQPRQLI